MRIISDTTEEKRIITVEGHMKPQCGTVTFLNGDFYGCQYRPRFAKHRNDYCFDDWIFLGELSQLIRDIKRDEIIKATGYSAMADDHEDQKEIEETIRT